MAKSKDQIKRDKFSKAILARIEKAGAADADLEVVDPDILRKADPALAAILDDYIKSKSWRTDPKSTAKQVAEGLLARDHSSDLSNLLAALETELSSEHGAGKTSMGKAPKPKPRK